MNSNLISHNEHYVNKQIDEIIISFSGGKDSTVLLDLVLKIHHQMNCKINLVPAYAAEITFPSTFKFIKTICSDYQKKYQNLKNPLIIPPKMAWNEILEKKGYPIYSKQISVLINRIKNSKTKNNIAKYFFNIEPEIYRTTRFKLSYKRLFLLDDDTRMNWPKIDDDLELKNYFKKYGEYYFFSEKCCDYVKGGLKHDKRPCFVGVMAEESELRKRSWIEHGCNILNKNRFMSRPLSLWNSDDIWRYIKENNINVNEAYGYIPELPLHEQNLRFKRLGCTSCPLGSHIEEKFKILNSKYNKQILNRFEKLKEWFPALYQTQIIDTGMYRVLMDMNIQIKNDLKYQELFLKRKKQIDEWYSSKKVSQNIIYVMCQIENYKNYKNKINSEWQYDRNDFLSALNFFVSNKTIDIDKQIIKYRKKAKSLYEKIHK